MREFLARRGVRVAFYPVDLRVASFKGRRRESERRFLPGYVFALFPREPVWHRLLATPERPDRPVRGVIRLASGEPARIMPRDVRGLWEMRSQAAALERRWRAERRLRPGPARAVWGDVLEGQALEVCELVAGKARVRLRLFGREVETDVDERRLMALREAETGEPR